MKNIKLTPWQESLVFGIEKSLAIPTPARAGKNIAIVQAAKYRPTLVIEPTTPMKYQLLSEAHHYQVPRIKISTLKGLAPRHFQGIEQIIINEASYLELVDILKIRDRFHGRVVIIGTPRDLPDKVFYPISKISEWDMLSVTTANYCLPDEIYSRLSRTQLLTSYHAQYMPMIEVSP